MDFEEIQNLISRSNAYVIAPAGHGKTEMLADIVSACEKKVLVLTHTNAGVDAIKHRFRKKGIPLKKANVGTIAGFYQRWCYSYPNTANFDVSLSRIRESKEFYRQLYSGAKAIFEKAWAGKVISESYAAIIVDEYQDCIIEQHRIFLTLNSYLPVWVLGDPLQGIFDWGDNNLVDWEKLPWTEVKIKTYPWRWKNTNPILGSYLGKVREEILPILKHHAVTVRLKPNDSYLKMVDPSLCTKSELLREWSKYNSVLYIADFERSQLAFCQQMGGIFQADEKQDCTALYDFASRFDSSNGAELLLYVLTFASTCASHVSTKLKSYASHLQKGSKDFSRIKKYTEIGKALSCPDDVSYDDLLRILKVISECKSFNFYRKELYEEMRRSIKYARDSHMSILEAAKHIRSDASLQKRYTGFRFLSSRTVLSKGLEYECVVIDMRGNLKAKDFYVAMTRATKMVYVISSNTTLYFRK
jgi:hypothetical protein